ncbi:MAG: hypothetical protein HXS48_05350 [Theionarchaea archaeon]|nr:MAG: hypothetical protein AYK19_02605 [Theionarchaea archaeon DG-70-1]MBU7026348.1 hypothetical protein [Theionarchaea archaeon]
MDCMNRERNLEYCNCTWASCSKKGMCCECVRSHRLTGELPACFFTDDVERTYDRSINRFIRMHR